MKSTLTVFAAVFAVIALVGVTNLIAGPSGKLSASDLDEPTSSFEAASSENNGSNENNDNNTPGENNEPPPPEVFGEPVPGKKILFILDYSCSMGTTHMNRLKTEVSAAIDALKANNDTLKAQWAAGGSVGPEPKIEYAMLKFSSNAYAWRSTLTECNAAGAAAGKAWVAGLYSYSMTSWAKAFQVAQTFGGVFDTIFFNTDGYPNYYQPWDPHGDALAALYASKTDGMRFIAQFFNTSYYYGGTSSGQTEMQRCCTRMDGKPNVTGVFSAVS